MRKKEQKEMEQFQERERLTIQINKYGDVKRELDLQNSEEEKCLALKIQLKFKKQSF